MTPRFNDEGACTRCWKVRDDHSWRHRKTRDWLPGPRCLEPGEPIEEFEQK